MSETKNELLSLADLAEVTGVPARTIRLYISRGLLPRPHKAGRGASYGREHVARLKEIRELQKRGLTLREIALHGKEGAAREAIPPAQFWASYPIQKDVIVAVRADVSPWRAREVQRALARLVQELSGKGEAHEDPR